MEHVQSCRSLLIMSDCDISWQQGDRMQVSFTCHLYSSYARACAIFMNLCERKKGLNCPETHAKRERIHAMK